MTNPDSLAKVAEWLRAHGDESTASRLERLDAEMRKKWDDEVDRAIQSEVMINDLRARLAACENLRAFANEALENFWEGDGTMQDLGEKHGLLIPTIVNEPCGEGCSCAEYGADFPTDCYKFAPILRTPTAHPDVPGGETAPPK